jgi:hypothetical protein
MAAVLQMAVHPFMRGPSGFLLASLTIDGMLGLVGQYQQTDWCSEGSFHQEYFAV